MLGFPSCGSRIGLNRTEAAIFFGQPSSPCEPLRAAALSPSRMPMPLHNANPEIRRVIGAQTRLRIFRTQEFIGDATFWLSRVPLLQTGCTPLFLYIMPALFRSVESSKLALAQAPAPARQTTLYKNVDVCLLCVF